MVDGISNELSDIDLCATVSEVNLVGSNSREWWIDTEATRHICFDKVIFPSLKIFNADGSSTLKTQRLPTLKGKTR